MSPTARREPSQRPARSFARPASPRVSRPAPPARPPRRARPERDRRRRDAKPKPTFKENVRFYVKAILIILVVRAFLIEPYRIPSESMEDTLLVGDFLIVSKLHYGARTPATLGIPVTGLFVPGLEIPQTRLPGFDDPDRGDVVVFNYPADLDVERGPISEAVPIERRTPYIKRIVAVPSDTVAVLDKVVHLNGHPVPLGPTMQQRWTVRQTGMTRPDAELLERLGVEPLDGTARLATAQGPVLYDVFATTAEAQALAARSDVAAVEPSVTPEEARDQTFGRNPDHMAPFVVPGKGMAVRLSDATWATYGDILTRYEGRTVTRSADGGFLVDGRPTEVYPFRQNYYFVMGDSRDNSVDGRYWGVVPETHLVGRALFTFISFKSWLPPIPRLTRFFRPIP